MVKRAVTEAHRRSARISALEERARVRRTKDLAGTSSSLPEASRKRGRKLESLLSVVTKSLANLHGQGVINLTNNDSAAQPHELEHESSPQQMPTKQKLEFFLDVLQRRDKYEIFAQPVNGQEVVGYYTIIEEPMDFGTMRAKLQEGMYTSLDQFERDVFLIFSNAMKFNASNTVYYTEAQAISKMAQRLLRSLRTEPENFQLELTRTRRRPGRRAQGQASNSPARAPKSSFLNDFSLKRKAIGPSHSNLYTGHKKNNESTSGVLDDRNFETDKRLTYMPQTIGSENEMIVSAVLDAPKSLQQVNSAASHYSDSLMRFSDGLGPQVETVARGKYPTEAPLFGPNSGIGSLIPAAFHEGDHSYAPTSSENMELLIATLSQISSFQRGHNPPPQNIREEPCFTWLLNHPHVAPSTRIREGPDGVAPSPRMGFSSGNGEAQRSLANTPLRMGLRPPNREELTFRPMQLKGTVPQLAISTQADRWSQLGPTPTPVQVPIINPINFLAGANSPEHRQDQTNAQIFGSDNGNGLPDLDLQL